MSKNIKEIKVYDQQETTHFIQAHKSLTFEDINLKLPLKPPTEVVSIRLPTQMVNQLRSLGSKNDIPYQALIKLFLASELKKYHNKFI